MVQCIAIRKATEAGPSTSVRERTTSLVKQNLFSGTKPGADGLADHDSVRETVVGDISTAGDGPTVALVALSIVKKAIVRLAADVRAPTARCVGPGTAVHLTKLCAGERGAAVGRGNSDIVAGAADGNINVACTIGKSQKPSLWKIDCDLLLCAQREPKTT